MADTLSIKSTEDAKENEAKKRRDEAESHARMEDAKLAYYAMLNLVSWKRIDENYSDKAESVAAEREKDKSATLETDDKNRGKLRAGVYKRTPPIVDGEDYQIKVTGDDDKNQKGYSIIPAPKGKDFDKSYGALIDFVKANSGNDVITLNWTNEQIQNGYCDPQAVKAILLIAKEKNVAVQFGPELQGYLTSSKIKPEVREGLFRLKVDVEHNRNVKQGHKDLRKKNIFELYLTKFKEEKELKSEIADNANENPSKEERLELFKAKIDALSADEKTTFVTNEITEIERRLSQLESAKSEMQKHVTAVSMAVLDRHPVLHDQSPDKKDENEKTRIANRQREIYQKKNVYWANYATDLDPAKIKEIRDKDKSIRNEMFSAIDKEYHELDIRLRACKEAAIPSVSKERLAKIEDGLKAAATDYKFQYREIEMQEQKDPSTGEVIKVPVENIKDISKPGKEIDVELDTRLQKETTLHQDEKYSLRK